ncbi:probable DNA mismatch repair protein Msh6 isoform X1 [Anoplophora glabripennis]|nr:probable DNA mismatch repair protein Msh6 isoform X1 [Anoplophora glabripennis]
MSKRTPKKITDYFISPAVKRKRSENSSEQANTASCSSITQESSETQMGQVQPQTPPKETKRPGSQQSEAASEGNQNEPASDSRPASKGKISASASQENVGVAGPSGESTSKDEGTSTPEDSAVQTTDASTTAVDSPESDEEIIKPKKRSRIQFIEDSSDSDSGTPKKSAKQFKFKNGNDSDNENDSPNTLKHKKSKKLVLNGSAGKPKRLLKEYSFQKGTPVKELQVNNVDSKKDSQEAVIKDIHSNWLHNNLDFLEPDKIKDINRRRPSDPNYDSRTLYVPESFLKDLTPAMRQWWELKSRHMDSVLFFKVGKFYELYNMDAVVGVMHLGFSYMKGEFAHSGFPESAYAKMASTLIEKGFKVARVEQTETPEMMADRCKKQGKVTKFDKVVKREICQVSTKATCVYTAQMPEARNELPNYMYAVSMKQNVSGNIRIGVCFVETSIGIFYMSEFVDDKHFSRLLALFAEYPAALILTERGVVSKKFSELLNTYFKDVQKDSLLSKNQFYTASDTLEKLSMANYFMNKEGNFYWPEFFKKVADDCMPKSEYELCLKSLGACMWYLKDSKLDIQVLSMGKFEWYDPLDLISEEKKVGKDYLILDSITINNLNLLGTTGSLQSILDQCETAFGKRLLQRWICRPLCDVNRIKERQIAVNELWNNPTLLKNSQAVLKKMPDLQRQLTKIHAYGNKFMAKDHPDSRAIFYESVTYSKTKIKDFLKTLRAFEKAQEISDIFSGCESRLLRKITQFSPKGANVDLREILQFFKSAFDQEEAEKEGKIIPKRGVEEDFDNAEKTIDDIKKKLADYLDEQSKFFGCKISYFGTDKKRFQLDVPESRTSKVTNEYQLEGTKKSSKPSKRYSTPKTRELLSQMLKAEAERAKIVLDLNRRIFEKIGERHEQFDQAIQCLTILDVLCSLAEYARTYSQDICIPHVKQFDEKPQLVIENGRHPCIPNVDNFVPNDITMGDEDHADVLILTGPNMGGKSTLMRQVAIISIMAQIGSCVPASTCHLNLIDRVFTRLGAQDDIIQGQSTFYVELSEASSILQHATKHSLVIIDELGRGTSTHDGNAIATAYVKKITSIGCRTMFSTHYHSLVDHFIGQKEVQLGHMACMVENDEDSTEESVTFLYKIAEGRCPKSYGFNAARLAGLDYKVVARGREIAKELEEESRLRNIFHIIFTSKNISERRNVFNSIV